MTSPPIRPEDTGGRFEYKRPAGPLAGGVYFHVDLTLHVIFDLDRDLIYESAYRIEEEWTELGPRYFHEDTLDKVRDRLPPQHKVDLHQAVQLRE